MASCPLDRNPMKGHLCCVTMSYGRITGLIELSFVLSQADASVRLKKGTIFYGSNFKFEISVQIWK